MLLVSGWFDVSRTIIPEAGSTFSSPHHAATLILSVDWGLARAYNLSIEDRLAREHQLLTAGQGQVALLGIDDYDEARNYPRPGEDVTAWEACHRMAWHMQPGEAGRGAQGCVAVAQRAGDRLDDVERLARILYDVYDRRNDSRRAVAFNSVVTAWPNIAGQASGPAQQELLI